MTAPGSQQKSIQQVGLIVLLSLACYFSGFFVFLTPLPLVYVALTGSHKNWRRCFLFSLVLISLFYWLLVPPLHNLYSDNPHLVWLLPVPGLSLYPNFGLLPSALYGLTYFGFFAAISLLIATLLRDPLAEMIPLAKNIAKLLLAVVGVYLFLSILLFDSPIEPLLANFKQGLNTELSNPDLAKSGIPPELIALIKKEQDVLAETMVYLLPAFVTCATLFFILFNTVIARRIFFHVVPVAKTVSMNRWRYPFELVWVVIGGLALVFINDFVLAHIKPISYIAMNLLLVVFCLYLFQGLGIVSFYMESRKVGPFFRALGYFSLFCLFFPAGLFCLIILGIFDSWFNFRKLGTQPASP